MNRDRYFLIGPHWDANLQTTVKHDARKINKEMGNELFQPGPGKFLFLVLTYHPTISLFSPKYWIKRDKRSRSYHVEGELYVLRIYC